MRIISMKMKKANATVKMAGLALASQVISIPHRDVLQDIILKILSKSHFLVKIFRP